MYGHSKKTGVSSLPLIALFFCSWFPGVCVRPSGDTRPICDMWVRPGVLCGNWTHPWVNTFSYQMMPKCYTCLNCPSVIQNSSILPLIWVGVSHHAILPWQISAPCNWILNPQKDLQCDPLPPLSGPSHHVKKTSKKKNKNCLIMHKHKMSKWALYVNGLT